MRLCQTRTGTPGEFSASFDLYFYTNKTESSQSNVRTSVVRPISLRVMLGQVW